MNHALSEALQKVSALPKERQDDAAQILLAMIENDARPYQFSPEQLEEIDAALAEADAGALATAKETREVLFNRWA